MVRKVGVQDSFTRIQSSGTNKIRTLSLRPLPSVSPRLLLDLSSLPRVVDADGDTVKAVSSDGLSYEGTVEKRGVGKRPDESESM